MLKQKAFELMNHLAVISEKGERFQFISEFSGPKAIDLVGIE